MSPEERAAKTIHYGKPCKGPEGMGRELGLCAFCEALSADFRAALRERDAAHEAALAHAREAAWVIERGDSQPGAPTYWAGIDAWSQSHLDAVRFRRKEDAERVASGLRFYPNCRIVEHMWIGPLRALLEEAAGPPKAPQK